MNNKTRIVVAMSGGVDSSVAAYLLKKEGFDVVGISLKLWDYDEPHRKPTKTCCSFEDIKDARKVCEKLDMPFYAFNYKEQFTKNVVEKFVSEYHEGRTPNPCILCNKHIKFDLLWEEAKKMGADFLATGHYARIEKDEKGNYQLLKGVDADKDQSYVLYNLKPEMLSRLKFPVGGFSKSQIRELAKEAQLVTATKPESMDICFIPNNDYAAFIKKNYPAPHLKAGNFVDEEGNILGQHEGIHAYTVGQRRGLGVSDAERLYVIRIDVQKNEVVLGKLEETFKAAFTVKDLSLISPLDADLECDVKIRYQKNEIPARVSCQDGSATVYFKEKARGVTPGQSAVFYKNNAVLGGGLIDRVL